MNKKLVCRLYCEEGLGIRRRKPRRRKSVQVREARPPTGQTNESWSMDFMADHYFNGVKFDFSRPGKPTDNAVIELFNGWLRDECLNQHWFSSLDEARAVTEAWQEDYNRGWPHGALGNRTPSEFARPVAGHAQLPALHG